MNSSTETILLYIIAAGIISIIYGFFTGRNILNSSSGNARKTGRLLSKSGI